MDAQQAIADAVKSAILDRLLDDLRNDRPIVGPRSVYTKSDNGVYGKYEKQDVPSDEVLASLRATLERLVSQHEAEGADEGIGNDDRA